MFEVFGRMSSVFICFVWELSLDQKSFGNFEKKPVLESTQAGGLD